jgi:SAM-dependent MidA family methyltransferase
MPFDRFMDLALYYPNLGYYERQAETVGRAGDFFTSVSVGSLFGELLAFQFVRWLDELPLAQGTLRSLQILEAGAHDGRLAFDVLSWIRQCRSDLLPHVEYWILEPSAPRQQAQAQTLRAFKENIRWVASWDSIPSQSIRGVIYSNELLDAFPVRRFGWNAAERHWVEWAVAWEDGHFVWAKRRGVGPAVPSELAAELPDGFTVEISPAAEAWWSQAASRLAHGKLLTIDYGLAAEEFFAPQRAHGTLRAYHRHHLSSDLLDHVGEQDLTSQVNFNALLQKGEAAGLRTEGLIPQAKFLTEILQQTERSPGSFSTWTPARLRQFQTLTHPEHLGRSFKVLIQAR